MEDQLLYRVPEVAVILNISRSKVYELFGSGDLPSVKIDPHALGPRLRPAVDTSSRFVLWGWNGPVRMGAGLPLSWSQGFSTVDLQCERRRRCSSGSVSGSVWRYF